MEELTEEKSTYTSTILVVFLVLLLVAIIGVLIWFVMTPHGTVGPSGVSGAPGPPGTQSLQDAQDKNEIQGPVLIQDYELTPYAPPPITILQQGASGCSGASGASGPSGQSGSRGQSGVSGVSGREPAMAMSIREVLPQNADLVRPKTHQLLRGFTLQDSRSLETDSIPFQSGSWQLPLSGLYQVHARFCSTQDPGSGASVTMHWGTMHQHRLVSPLSPQKASDVVEWTGSISAGIFVPRNDTSLIFTAFCPTASQDVPILCRTVSIHFQY